MTYPPPNPYDPNQSPGYGQPSAPQHYTTDADPYSRPDPYGPGTGYNSAPNHPGSAPPGQPYSPGPAYAPGQTGGYQPPTGPPGGAFQVGQAAPPPPGASSSNLPLIITLVVVVVAVIGGGILLAVNMGGGEPDPDPTEAVGSSSAAEESSEPVEETSEAASEEATSEGESVYRVPAEGECIENNTEGFYVIDCAAESAYWEVLKIVQSPEDPEPTDAYHSVAAADACEGSGNTNYYYTDTAIAAGREWDPDIDSITAVYCVKEV